MGRGTPTPTVASWSAGTCSPVELRAVVDQQLQAVGAQRRVHTRVDGERGGAQPDHHPEAEAGTDAPPPRLEPVGRHRALEQVEGRQDVAGGDHGAGAELLAPGGADDPPVAVAPDRRRAVPRGHPAAVGADPREERLGERAGPAHGAAGREAV